jgi:hypothetical protein
MIQQSDDVRELLEKDMGIDPDEGIESVLFVLKETGWSKRREIKKKITLMEMIDFGVQKVSFKPS